jgi:hypothetical protein
MRLIIGRDKDGNSCTLAGDCYICEFTEGGYGLADRKVSIKAHHFVLGKGTKWHPPPPSGVILTRKMTTVLPS